MTSFQNLYKIVIPYSESANPNKRFKIEYTIEAPDRETALKRAEREFMGYTQYSSASWVRILDREGLRAWRILPDTPQTIQEIDKLAGGLESLDPDTLYNVLKALGDLEEAAFAKKVVPLLKHENVDIAALAAETLGKMGDKSVLPSLIENFRPETHPRIKACILSAVSRLATSNDPIEDLISLALGDPDSRVRANAVELVEKLKLSKFALKLVPMLADEDNRVRANVLKALWTIHDRAELTKTLEDMIENQNRWMRISAAFVLRHIDVPQRKQMLEQLLKDDDPDVRLSAQHTLFATNDDECLLLFLEILADNPNLFDRVVQRLQFIDENKLIQLKHFKPRNREHSKIVKKLFDAIAEKIYKEKGFVQWLKFKSSSLFTFLRQG